MKLGKICLIHSIMESLGNYLTELLSNWKQFSLGFGIKYGFSLNLGKYLIFGFERSNGNCALFAGSVSD